MDVRKDRVKAANAINKAFEGSDKYADMASSVLNWAHENDCVLAVTEGQLKAGMRMMPTWFQSPSCWLDFAIALESADSARHYCGMTYEPAATGSKA